MDSTKLNRRCFLKRTTVAAAATTVLAALFEPVSVSKTSASESLKPILLGGSAYLGAEDPDALAFAHEKLGYSAAYCPDIALNDSAKIKAVADAFSKRDIVIAEVGRWCNLLAPNEETRRKNLQTVTEGLALADEVGARCCVDIAGSYNKEVWYGPHPDNLSKRHFDAIVENARKIIDAVKPKRAKFSYEIMGWALPDSPDNYVKVIKAVDRAGFGVHLDPCNAVNSPEKIYNNTALLNECFDKLGKWIVSCHAKDLAWEVELNVHFREVLPGKGVMDYGTYLKRLAQLPNTPPLMLEHLSKPEEYAAARDYIFAIGKKNGLTFKKPFERI